MAEVLLLEEVTQEAFLAEVIQEEVTQEDFQAVDTPVVILAEVIVSKVRQFFNKKYKRVLY